MKAIHGIMMALTAMGTLCLALDARGEVYGHCLEDPADGCSVPEALERSVANANNPSGLASFEDACDEHDRCDASLGESRADCDDDDAGGGIRIWYGL
jgi:hypothetical protein